MAYKSGESSVPQPCKIELPRKNSKIEGENGNECWGVAWEIDDSTKFTLAVIPQSVINCRDKLTPKPLGSHKLYSMGPKQRLWKWTNLFSMTLMIFKWPWHNFFCFPYFLLYFAKFYRLKYMNYGNQLQKSNSSSASIMFCQMICLCKPASKEKFSPAEIKLRGNRKELPWNVGLLLNFKKMWPWSWLICSICNTLL